MKHNYKNKILAAFMLSASMISCDQESLMPDVTEDEVIGDGITEIANKLATVILGFKGQNDNTFIIEVGNVEIFTPKLHEVPTYDINLSNLTKDDLTYVAFGGTMSAGVINGGYHNEGMMTAYPNLIARQLKIKNFKQPYFPEQYQLGYGKRVVSQLQKNGEPMVKYKISSNQTLNIGDYNVDGVVHNLSIPFFGRGNIAIGYTRLKDLKEPQYLYANGLVNNKSENLMARYGEVDFNIFTLETGYDDLLSFAFGDSQGLGISASYALQTKNVDDMLSSVEMRMMSFIEKKASERGKKMPAGFISTIPNFLEFPRMKLYTYGSSLVGLKSRYIYYKTNKNGEPETYENVQFGDFYVPNSETDSLFSENIDRSLKPGTSKETALKRSSIIKASDILPSGNYVNQMNEHFYQLSKKYGVHIVDLNALFTKIINGEYVTWDGIKADASYQNGNFFNADGLSLTPFGQSIVANAFLEKINEVYKTNVPLISTKYYLELTE